ncbi:hypothetical protein, partial [Saccharopolyspora kobensis]|uniref:hypothetical protein n=1 Tax=Saccharopolyspora kobensis TaxID=146035 RepID=UPI001C6FC8D8
LQHRPELGLGLSQLPTILQHPSKEVPCGHGVGVLLTNVRTYLPKKGANSFLRTCKITTRPKLSSLIQKFLPRGATSSQLGTGTLTMLPPPTRDPHQGSQKKNPDPRPPLSRIRRSDIDQYRHA